MLERMWVPTLGLENWFDLLAAFWSQLVAICGAFWSQSLAICGLPRRQVKAPSVTIGQRPFSAKSWPGGAFWRQILAICRRPGRQVTAPSGIIGKWAFWAKAWPGAFWSQILVLWRLLEASGKPLGSLWEASGKPLGSLGEAPGKLPETAVPLRQARGGQRTPRHKRFSGKDFPSRTRRAGRPFWSL